MLAYIMSVYAALLVLTCVLGTYLITHAHRSNNVAGKRRSSRLRKAATNDNEGSVPFGSAALSAVTSMV